MKADIGRLCHNDTIFFQAAKETIPEGQTKFETTNDLGDKVKTHTSPAGCERIRQDLQLLTEEYDNLTSIVTEVESALESSISGTYLCSFRWSSH